MRRETLGQAKTAALLVLDNICRTEDFDSFIGDTVLELGSHCRVLMLGRDSKVLQKVGGDGCRSEPMPMLAEQEARELLLAECGAATAAWLTPLPSCGRRCPRRARAPCASLATA